ncbi:hypothetical protein MVEN_00540900 [Mycena venus]|uniref:Uncharacterized protein n=1 Tax=Mycena venus TaxID=2733690 RepID=A0A8H7D4J1_9AGAR|nr:hypothetical protein MVEN_00540900 [Mycena venus]
MPERTGPRFSLSFWGMVGAVMIALKLKESMDDCKYLRSSENKAIDRAILSDKQVSTEEEGRIALGDGEPSAYRDVEGNEEAISLINTDITVTRPKRKRAKCCMCCGLDCSLFWKAFGIVVGIFVVWNGFKLIKWALTPSPTGLEDMPTYSTSLGCVSAPYTYAGKPTSFNVPIGSENADHGFDIRGGAVGTITVLEGQPSATKVTYDVTIRSNDKSLLNDIVFDHPVDQDAEVKDSHLLIVTPRPSEEKCIRYDVKMYVPPTLKKLHLQSHTVSHVQFDPESHIQLDDFFVTLFSPKRLNMILPPQQPPLAQDAARGVRGRGRGVMNVRVHPTLALDPASPEVATLRTTSGSGRTDIFYVTTGAHVHRPISSTHMSSMNADMYLTYRDAQYSGLIELAAKSYTATGVSKIGPPDAESQEKWTHWVGDEQGQDELSIKTRGWAGVYF